MPAWLEYAPRNTVMHRLHPLVKVVLTITLLALAGLYWDLRLLLIVGLVGIIFARVARVPPSWFKVLVGFLIAFIPTTLIGIFGQTNPALFQVYPQSLVSVRFFTFSLGPLGIYGVTVGGLLWGIASDLRVGIVLLFTYTFLYSTSFSDIMEMLGSSKFPKRLLFVIIVAYRFVPEMVRQLQVILTAMKLRGWEIRSRNPKVVMERTIPLITSLMRHSLVTIDEVSLATRIRAFGTGKITPLKYPSPSIGDSILIFATLAIFAVALYELIFSKIGLL